MISILVNSRIEGNVNHSLHKFLDSISEFTSKPSEIEVLIKYDNDDAKAYAQGLEIINAKYPFKILCESGPRGRGYIDIHHGYNQLLPSVSPKSRVICAMADDFTVNARWDDAVHNEIEDAGDLFIVHQRPHPRIKWDDKIGILSPGESPFCMSDDMFDSENMHIIDEAPMWSPTLLRSAYVGKMMTFPVSFTDAWTICLEHVLWVDHQINITKFLPELFINRKTCSVDEPGNERWNTDRKINFEYIKSAKFRGYVLAQAREIACQLSEKVSRV